MINKKFIVVFCIILLVAGLIEFSIPAPVVSHAQGVKVAGPIDGLAIESMDTPTTTGSDLTDIPSGQNPAVQELALAVDGWEQVNTNGFGDPQTVEVSALASFNNYLYAGIYNATNDAQIFRSPDGVTWTAVTEPGFGNSHDIAPPAILDLTVFKSYLYASTGRRNASQIWRTLNGTTWAPMDVTGFSNPDNVDVTALAEYGGKIYAGVTNQVSGAQIWSSFTGDNNSWTKVAPATPGTIPASVTGFAVFDGALYAAIEYESDASAQVWRSYGGAWETIVSNGFGNSNTVFTGGLAEYGGYLYVGAGNANSGAQLWRTNDGATWEQTITSAFGDTNNQKVESVYVFQNQLFVSINNGSTGIEIWRSNNGTSWQQANQDGFGDSNNSGSNWSNATAEFSNHLYVGTSNAITGGELWRMQQPFGVTLSPDQAKPGSAGQTVTYTLWITNTGHTSDGFNLTTSGQTWATHLSTSLVNLPPSASDSFTVAVEIPSSAADHEIDTVTVTATSQGDASMTDSAALTTTSISTPIYGVSLSNGESLSGPVGKQVLYTLTITNTGNVVDTFNLLATGNSWTTTLSSKMVTLAAGGSQSVTITVLIPPDAVDQATDTVNISATSQGDNSKTDSAVFTTTGVAAPVYGVTLSGDETLSGPAGGQVLYTLTITNTGNVVDTFDLLATGNSWTTTLSSKMVTLAAGSSQGLTITVLIPSGVFVGESDQVTIQATSRHDSTKQDSVVLTTLSANQLAKIYLPIIVLNTLQ
jgi:hypothetical protein